MSEEQLKRDFPFDQYGRYAIIRDIIDANREPGAAYRVLDVGGRGNIMQSFLAADAVSYLDPNLAEEDRGENYVEGDGCDLPLADGSFDFVVSADVFEHIPAGRREDFLRENLRVARRGVILAAPFCSPENEAAERHANEVYKAYSGGEEHAWLREHIELGLPAAEEVERFLVDGGYAFQRIPNNDILLWESMLYANFLAAEDADWFGELNRFYNEELFPRDHEEKSYRTIYFIKKDAGLMDLELEAGGIDTGLRLAAVRHSLEFLARVHARDRARIKRLTEEGYDNQRLLAETGRALRERQEQVERMRATLSWKLTRPFRLVSAIWSRARRLPVTSSRIVRAGGSHLFLYKLAGAIADRLPFDRLAGFGPRARQYLDIREWYQEHGRKVTIVVPSYNDHVVLKRCLDSIAGTVEPGRADVIVVDDASTDTAHAEFLRSVDGSGGVRVIYREENGGFARTVNAGLREAGDGDVVILNSDTEARRYWLESLQYAAYLDERTGIVGAKLLYPDGRIQYGGSHRNTGAPEWFDHYYRFRPSSWGPANVPNYLIGVTGACMYVRGAVIERIGLLDEGFGMAFEDMDFCIRAWGEGYRSLYYPLAVLTHHESATRDYEQGEREMASLAYFWRKWGDWFDGRNVLNGEGRLRIIYVLQSTGVGGGHRLVFEHLNRLHDMGHAVELYALEGSPKWFPLRPPVTRFDNYDDLVSVLSEQEAIKVATWWETAEPVWLASVNRGIAVYYVQDIETSYYQDDPFLQQQVLSRYRKEFAYITESHWNGERLAEMGLKSQVIGCGIDEEVFHTLDLEREDNVILSVGRSHYLKNLAMTLEAWEGITANQPQLWMFGIEPELAEGRANARYFTAPGDAELNELYNRATIFVQTSRHEGLCLPILEAMAAGAAVICTDAHGNADFCVDGENCIMVDHDDVAGLRAAITRLLADGELRERLCRAGLRTAHAYSWPVVMRQLEEFYRATAAIRPEAHPEPAAARDAPESI